MTRLRLRQMAGSHMQALVQLQYSDTHQDSHHDKRDRRDPQQDPFRDQLAKALSTDDAYPRHQDQRQSVGGRLLPAFEAARLPDGRIPALDPGVRFLRPWNLTMACTMAA